MDQNIPKGKSQKGENIKIMEEKHYDKKTIECVKDQKKTQKRNCSFQQLYQCINEEKLEMGQL